MYSCSVQDRCSIRLCGTTSYHWCRHSYHWRLDLPPFLLFLIVSLFRLPYSNPLLYGRSHQVIQVHATGLDAGYQAELLSQSRRTYVFCPWKLLAHACVKQLCCLLPDYHAHKGKWTIMLLESASSRIWWRFFNFLLQDSKCIFFLNIFADQCCLFFFLVSEICLLNIIVYELRM